jgi:hypothetical protein
MIVLVQNGWRMGLYLQVLWSCVASCNDTQFNSWLFVCWRSVISYLQCWLHLSLNKSIYTRGLFSHWTSLRNGNFMLFRMVPDTHCHPHINTENEIVSYLRQLIFDIDSVLRPCFCLQIECCSLACFLIHLNTGPQVINEHRLLLQQFPLPLK